MDMRRKITETLRKWKLEDAGECALLIDGARRVGKSYIVEAFAKVEYPDYVLINFKYVGEDVNWTSSARSLQIISPSPFFSTRRIWNARAT